MEWKGSLTRAAGKLFVKKDDSLSSVDADAPETKEFTHTKTNDLGERLFPARASAYKLLECVGKGTEGNVWRAVCLPRKTEVAIKIVDLEALSNAALEGIKDQIHVMQLCNRHPNIVDYHASFIDSHYLWVVMPYLAGGSCSDIMKYGFPFGLDENAIRVVLKGALKALVFFHKNGRIHRDIKAGNILVSSKGHVQIADFGVSAVLAEQQNLRTTLCGTPCWMAPEMMMLAFVPPNQGAHTKGYGYAVDIWSFGITALELAKGRPPFSDYPTSKVFSMVTQNPPPSLSTDNSLPSAATVLSPNTRKKFSKSFQDMIGCCLQKDPAKRPTAEKLLKHKFFSKNTKKDYLVNHILYKLPPLGERFRIYHHPETKKPAPPAADPAENDFQWEFPEEYVYDAYEIAMLEARYLRSGRSLRSMSSASSLASGSFMSSASSSMSTYEEGWCNPDKDVGSVEFLNHIFHYMDYQ